MVNILVESILKRAAFWLGCAGFMQCVASLHHVLVPTGCMSQASCFKLWLCKLIYFSSWFVLPAVCEANIHLFGVDPISCLAATSVTSSCVMKHHPRAFFARCLEHSSDIQLSRLCLRLWQCWAWQSSPCRAVSTCLLVRFNRFVYPALSCKDCSRIEVAVTAGTTCHTIDNHGYSCVKIVLLESVFRGQVTASK